MSASVKMVIRCKRLVVKSALAAASSAETEATSARSPPAKRGSKRCAECSRKLSPSAGMMACRCGGVFCHSHRPPECHGCTFDFKTVAFHHRAPEVEYEKREWVGSRGR